MPKRILLIGGPSTGKSTLISELKRLGYPCLDEVSREVIKEAQEKGIDQLFLSEPLLFSELLLRARMEQFKEVEQLEGAFAFLDRGIPDTVAYMDFVEQEYTQEFVDACHQYRYDFVFILPPWEEIHTIDGERYESFAQAQLIQVELAKTYRKYDYSPVEVPIGPVEDRAQFILDTLSD